MHLMKHKLKYLIFSLVVILPGMFLLLTSGLKLGIDFTGGVLMEYRFEKDIPLGDFKKYGTAIQSGSQTYIIRSKHMETDELKKQKQNIEKDFGKFEIRREESVGPTIGKELELSALKAIVLASVLIVGYITYAFRKLPKPASSWRFGLAAIAALIHDVLLVVGIYAILGKFYNVEIDLLFVTALLTIIGFSVHDTIVVFDRIRENLPKYLSKSFEEVADISVTQTLARSLNTSLTVFFVLFALLLFGGESIRWFVVALLIGIISGTYSSIFNATALLVWWEDLKGTKFKFYKKVEA